MKETRIAKRYAKALFDFSLEHKVPEKIIDDMKLIYSVCKLNKDFILLLRSPIIKSDKKQNIINEIFKKHIHKVTLTYLLIITRKGRERFIKDIAEQFIILYKKYKGIITAHLTTAEAIDLSIRNQIIGLLKKQTKADIELIEEIKKELIGGFVLLFDDNQYDASIMKQIKKLQKEFDINLYIKGF